MALNPKLERQYNPDKFTYPAVKLVEEGKNLSSYKEDSKGYKDLIKKDNKREDFLRLGFSAYETNPKNLSLLMNKEGHKVVLDQVGNVKFKNF
jgi:hypothetical protein